MKSLFVLFLCGITCCFGQPKCSDDEVLNCFNSNFTVDVTEEIMENYCDQIQCMHEVFDRCGNPENLPFDAYKHTKEVYDTFCPKISSYRQKFMDQIKCIFRSIDKIFETCKPVTYDIDDHDEFCRNLSSQIQCVEELLTRRCSRDASEVAAKLSPSQKLYNCS